MTKTAQVAIVGGGPVGVSLALDLAMRGVSSVVIEKRTELGRIPKGQNLTARTMEHFYFWGIEKELRAARFMPPGYRIGEFTAYHDLMSKYWHAPPGREVVKEFYYQENERLPQYQLEGVLRTKLATQDLAEIRYGWTAEAIEQDDDGVRVTISDPDGSRETVTADYLIGCDGGRSMVREQAGISRGSKPLDQVMMLAVFRSKDLHERLKIYPERSTYRVLHPDDKGYWRFFGRIDVGESWFFHAPVPEGTTTENFDHLALLQAAAGFPCECDIDYIGFWSLQVAVAEEYRNNRIFIAGDAAHSHPPYGGFGLNNGLEDSVNLAWKLAARINGWGGETLLDSYAIERRPVFKETAEDFIEGRIARDRTFMERYSPEKDEEEFEQAWEARKTDIGSRFQQYEPSYEGSPVVVGGASDICTAHGTHTFKVRPGHHLAPRKLSSGENVFEKLGRDFNLIALDGDEQAIGRFEAAARNKNVPLNVVRGSYGGECLDYEAKYILVRPDQYVVWAGDSVPDDAEAIVAKTVG